MDKIKVTVWNEYNEKQKIGETALVYPKGLHTTIAEGLNRDKSIDAKTSTIMDTEQGLSQKVLDDTDVLVYWAHCMHNDVKDECVQRIIDACHGGMGIIFLHSAHKSKPFMRLLGTSGYLSWRDAKERERIWTATPSHPIAEGVPECFELEQEEMYGEPFGIPQPQDTVFIGWYQGGEVFRSGVTFVRESGKIFYFQPGHETVATYYDKNIMKILTNAIHWAKPTKRTKPRECPNVSPQEQLKSL